MFRCREGEKANLAPVRENKRSRTFGSGSAQCVAKARREKEKRVHELETKIAALEGQQKELAAALEDPAAYTPGGHATAINRDLSALSHDLARLTAGMGKRHRHGGRNTAYLRFRKVRFLAHQSEDIIFRVAKFRQPEIVSCHWRNQHRFSFEMNFSRNQRLMRLLDVCYFEVENRARMIQVRTLWNRQHQLDTAAIEESHSSRHAEKMFYAERLLVKRNCAIEIVHVHRNLADFAQRNVRLILHGFTIVGLTDEWSQKFQHRLRSWPAFLRMREQRNLMWSGHVHDVRESGHRRFDDVDLAQHRCRENVHPRIVREQEFGDVAPAHVGRAA